MNTETKRRIVVPGILYSLYHLNIKSYKFCIQTGETPYYHGNPYTFTQNSDTITETADLRIVVPGILFDV